MTQKTLGYVELEWTCQRCGTKNPGLLKTCTNCGAPMASADQFELPDEQKLITDEEKLLSAQKGPDLHCPFCGARNPADAVTCSQCGGDIKEGLARQAGQVLGAHTTGPAPEISCPYCAAQIPATSQRCPQCGGDLLKAQPKPAAAPAPQKMPLWLKLAIGLVALVCLGGAGALLLRGVQTEDLQATVQGVTWQRSVEVLEQRPVRQGDWEAELPAGAQDISCEDRYRETVDYAVPNATEVCGTPYTIDEGSGAGKVVQDCRYEVYASFCEYTAQEWQVVARPSAGGTDLQPYWPALSLSAGQREGNRVEQYLIRFAAGGEVYDYQVSDPAQFAAFAPGSTWTLQVNGFGQITEVLP